MAKTLTPDRPRAGIALAAVALTMSVASTFGQIGSIVMGAVVGLWFCRSAVTTQAGRLHFPVSRRAGLIVFDDRVDGPDKNGSGREGHAGQAQRNRGGGQADRKFHG